MRDSRRWARFSEVLAFVHAALGLTAVITIGLRLATGPGGRAVVAGIVLGTVALVLTVALVVAGVQLHRRRSRRALIGLVAYGLVGSALSVQALAGTAMAADATTGVLLPPFCAVVGFLGTALVAVAALVTAERAGSDSPRG